MSSPDIYRKPDVFHGSPKVRIKGVVEHLRKFREEKVSARHFLRKTLGPYPPLEVKYRLRGTSLRRK